MGEEWEAVPGYKRDLYDQHKAYLRMVRALRKLQTGDRVQSRGEWFVLVTQYDVEAGVVHERWWGCRHEVTLTWCQINEENLIPEGALVYVEWLAAVSEDDQSPEPSKDR